MDWNSKLRKAASLFVELPPEDTSTASTGGVAEPSGWEAFEAESATSAGHSKTVEQIVRDAPGPNLDEIAASASALTSSSAVDDGTVNFQSIYEQAGVPATPLSAEQTLDMLRSMPAELPLETKRQTVKVTLGAMGKAIGATPETIVADASRKLAALSAYAESMSQKTTDFTASAEREIAQLQALIEEKRLAIETTRKNQDQVLECCRTETDRLDDVLEFFSLDIAPSKHAPVK